MNRSNNGKLTAEVILPSRREPWQLYGLGDIHFWSHACDTVALRRDVAMIAEQPNARVVLMGDNFESISPDDIRFELDLHDQWSKGAIGAQIARLVEILTPIKDKIICGLTGNHEHHFERQHYMDLSQELYERMSVPYEGYSTIFPITVTEAGNHKSRYILKVFLHHGSGGGRKPGAKLNRIIDFSTDHIADVYMMGHVHDKLVYVKPTHTCSIRGGQRIAMRGFVITGTYYKTYMTGSTTYGERAGYSPTHMGCAGLKLWLNGTDELQMAAA